MESSVFLSDLLTGHEPEMLKLLEINKRIFMFMGRLERARQMRQTLKQRLASTALLLSVAFWLSNCGRSKPDDYWAARVFALSSNDFGFELPPAAGPVRASGGLVTKWPGRRRTETCMLYPISTNALKEVEAKLRPGKDMLFLRDHTATPDRDALKVAPWWQPENEGTGIWARSKRIVFTNNVVYGFGFWMFDRKTNGLIYVWVTMDH